MTPIFGARGDNPHVNDYFYKFWDNVFFPYLKEHEITDVVHLGDVVDRRKFINFKIADDFRTKFLNRFEEMGINLTMLVGNHDVYYKNTNNINALANLCYGRKNITLLPEAKEVVLDGCKVLMLPWINVQNYASSLDVIKKTDAQIIFGHLEISGFEMDRGNVCHEGMDRKLFDRFDKVISGHFHHKSSDGTIFYLGNQYQMTWADHGDRRGFHIFDTETTELEFVENPYQLFYKIAYDDKDHMTFEELKKIDFTEFANTYVKVVVVNKTNPYLFDTFMDELNKASPIDINIVEDIIDLTDGEDSDTMIEAEDTITILNKYVDANDLTVDGGKLKSILREIYVEAQNTSI